MNSKHSSKFNNTWPAYKSVSAELCVVNCCQLSDVAAAARDRSLMIDAYNAAVANVNNAVDNADSALVAINEMPCSDTAALKSRLALLQVLLSYSTFCID